MNNKLLKTITILCSLIYIPFMSYASAGTGDNGGIDNSAVKEPDYASEIKDYYSEAPKDISSSSSSTRRASTRSPNNR